jgi:hypothetical protein
LQNAELKQDAQLFGHIILGVGFWDEESPINANSKIVIKVD